MRGNEREKVSPSQPPGPDCERPQVSCMCSLSQRLPAPRHRPDRAPSRDSGADVGSIAPQIPYTRRPSWQPPQEMRRCARAFGGPTFVTPPPDHLTVRSLSCRAPANQHRGEVAPKMHRQPEARPGAGGGSCFYGEDNAGQDHLFFSFLSPPEDMLSVILEGGGRKE